MVAEGVSFPPADADADAKQTPQRQGAARNFHRRAASPAHPKTSQKAPKYPKEQKKNSSGAQAPLTSLTHHHMHISRHFQSTTCHSTTTITYHKLPIFRPNTSQSPPHITTTTITNTPQAHISVQNTALFMHFLSTLLILDQ